MSIQHKDPIQRLIYLLTRLPGIGEKTAGRLAFNILKGQESYARDLAQALIDVKTLIHPCSICCNLTDIDPCNICQNPTRNKSIICVVEQPSDVIAIERGKEFKGLYHILHGSLSPLDGIGPEQLKIQELIRRLQENNLKEVVIATDPDVEGEATAVYISKLIHTNLHPIDIKVTRIAHGIPVGSELEYVDYVTIQKAFDNRREM